MTKMLPELLWPVYFATLWGGTSLTKSRWLKKCHLVSRVLQRWFISQLQGVQGPAVSSVMLHDSSPRPPWGRMLWQGEGAVFHPVHVLHVICCTCWQHCERWAVHHSPSLFLAFTLISGVYSWPLQCQEISCYRILMEFSFFTCFVENLVSQEMQHCCKSFVTCWCMRS